MLELMRERLLIVSMKHASNDDSKERVPLFCPQRTIANAAHARLGDAH
jgi:hypothetical protein